jgi:RNA polymerase sigma-70 factor (ECF subfamily)
MSGTSPSPEFSLELVALLPRLRRYARVLTGDRFAADDLVQDTLERAWARHRQWRRGSDLRAWLFSIMHNRRVDIARGERFIVPEFSADSAERPVADDRGQSSEPELPDAIDPMDLQRAYARLSPEHQEVLLFVAVEQMSYAEAATAMSVPVGTVMSRLSRARARLREALAAPGAASPGQAVDDGAPRLTRVK